MPAGLLGVIGGGAMGVGIAHAGLLSGATVTLHEADAARAEAAATKVEALVRASAERGKLSGAPEELLARFAAHSDLAVLSASYDLVLEAVPEVLPLKQETLGAAERRVGPATVLASNTSSLSIDELAGHLRRPERFIGMHFFNPVPASALIEVVTGAATSAETRGRAQAWAAAMRKQAIVVRSSPGFASSRLGVALGLEAIRMVEEGVAAPADIDAAMTLGYKHPLGPLRLTDLVGLDVRLDIAVHLHRELGERFAPPRLLRDMVAGGTLGTKTGQGFYSWPQDGG